VKIALMDFGEMLLEDKFVHLVLDFVQLVRMMIMELIVLLVMEHFS
jgi:hypothetical protein